MKPAFEDENLWRIFKEELLSWEGTPYRHLQMQKHRGVDCTLLMCSALKKAKILTEIEVPEYYPKDWYSSGMDVIEKSFALNFNTHCNEKYEWQRYNGIGNLVGDVELFSFHKNNILHHSAILLEGNKIYHCTPTKSATAIEFSPKMRKFCKAHYRLMEK